MILKKDKPTAVAIVVGASSQSAGVSETSYNSNSNSSTVLPTSSETGGSGKQPLTRRERSKLKREKFANTTIAGPVGEGSHNNSSNSLAEDNSTATTTAGAGDLGSKSSLSLFLYHISMTVSPFSVILL